MAHGMVESGADVALVDLNREQSRAEQQKRASLTMVLSVEEAQRQASQLVEQFQKENPDTER